MLQIEQDPTPIRTRLYHLILDDIPVGTVHIYGGYFDKIQEELQRTAKTVETMTRGETEVEAAYLLEEQGKEIASLLKKLQDAQLLLEKFKETQAALVDALRECLYGHPDVRLTPEAVHKAYEALHYVLEVK